LALAQSSVTVTGRVIQEVSRVYSLEASSETQTFANVAAHLDKVAVSVLGTARESHIWQNLPKLSFGSQIELLSLAVLQTAEPELTHKQDALLRDWPQADVGVAKHYGYAFQWFALCILILVLYVWFQIFAPRRRKS
jgi:cytochrome oxidase assembly protein ShyY1